MSFAERSFQIHAAVWFAVNAFLVLVWALTGGGMPWFLFPAGGWGIGLAAHAVATYTRPIRRAELEAGERYKSL